MVIEASDIKNRHCGDTFRELVSLWVSNDLCRISYNDKKHSCWLNGNMLYDEPTLEWYNRYPYEYNFALFGNTVPDLENSSSWIFWSRRPSLLEECRSNILPYYDRDIESIFLGKIENNVQHHKRTQQDWSESVEVFEMPIQGPAGDVYKYSQLEYLKKIKSSKYGLCLSGYGPKCNREIELMGLGTVPIISPMVDLTYYNPLEEGVHYIKVNSPNDVKDTIDSISIKHWEEMSNNCLEWYSENASPQGSFNTTIQILEKNNAL